MATTTELYREILNNLGVDCDNLPDNLTTTLLKAIAQNCGGGGSAGGGVPTALFNGTEEEEFACENMTYDEAVQIVTSTHHLQVHVGLVSNGVINSVCTRELYYYPDEDFFVIYFQWDDDECCLYWSRNGVSYERLGSNSPA